MSGEERLDSGLYIVPTPIGNLEDITLRAKRILEQVDIIACEDTRHTGSLLKKLEIPKKKLESYHEHNEKSKSEYLVNEILSGNSLALVSDAGTPGISDPGFRIVQKAIEADIAIVSLPGPTAFIPALVASGLPWHNFLFLGFPPQKKGRQSFLKKAAEIEYTMVLYESPYRIIKLLNELTEYFGPERNICLAREISKLHEEYIRGSVAECLETLNKRDAVKGEFVVLVEGWNK